MSETRYMISDMAKKVDVEAHVLRYWEEELDIGVSRTELGHRYYTEEDIRLFRKIKELKERGLQIISPGWRGSGKRPPLPSSRSTAPSPGSTRTWRLWRSPPG